MEFLSFSHKGKRESNQDVVLGEKLSDDGFLALVVDGMGGYDNGDKAARIIAENIHTYLEYSDTIDEYHIQKAINKANLAVKQEQQLLSSKMGATVGGVVVKSSEALVFWVGDVKIIHFRNNELIWESTPHTLKNELKGNGNQSEVVNLSKYNHIVTRAVQGDVKGSKAEFRSVNFIPITDALIVCSDGVHDIIDSVQIQMLMKIAEDSVDALKIIEKRLLVEGRDNFSVGLLR